ncbi:MAG: C_GCAxxG_C_C family protein [Phycisphaerae bacterium]
MTAVTRRELFARTGQMGIAAGVGALVAYNGCAPADALLPTDSGQDAGTDTGQDTGTNGGGTVDAATAKWPLAYAKLDVEYVRKLGHQQFYEGDCCYGAFSAIVKALGEQVGEPFASFPRDMMRYGKGGVYGYGTLCGALNGAAAAIQLVTDESTAGKVITELLNWYAVTELPTDQSNQYAANHEFLVETLKTDEILPRNAAGNVLCHTSVSKWSVLSGYASGSEQRKERCARLTGDVAAKAVELLNAVQDATFTPLLTSPGEQAGCMNCHKPGLDFVSGNFTQGKMDCETCHVTPVIAPHDW